MTEQEQRQLDEWIAEHGLGWIKNRRVWNTEPGGTVLCFPSIAEWSPTRNVEDFVEVKREIERRGWCWMSTGSSKGYEFTIWRHVNLTEYAGLRTPSGFSLELARAYAKTEEMAGCLAFKQALEATEQETQHV